MRPRLTYANVIATLALFIALGGSSYAAVQLSKGQVKTRHIAKNAVNSAKVKDGSLLAHDFQPGQLPAGPKGDQGPQGPKGDKGTPGATNTTVRSSPLIYVASNSDGDGSAFCNAGERATGGGVDWLVRGTGSRIVASIPNGTGWYAEWNPGTVSGGGNGAFKVYVVCASP